MHRIFSISESLNAKGRVTDKTRKGLAVGLSIWWEKVAHDGKNANKVTSQPLADVGCTPTYYDVLAQVKKDE